MYNFKAWHSLPNFSESLDVAGFLDTSFFVTCHCFPSHTSSSSYSASESHSVLQTIKKQVTKPR